MQKCPIQSCGRQFDNELTMLEHVKRRHPMQAEKIKQKTTNQMIQKQQKITQQINKLPKMNRIMQMSKQKKPLQFQRRSTSKKNKQILNTIESNSIKVADIINQSRQLLEENNNNSKKILKRASSSKINTQEINNNSNNEKLPNINTIKGKRLKLESLKQSTLDKSINNTNQLPKQRQRILLKRNSQFQIQTQNQMYSTAPNFAKQSLNSKIQSIRSRSKGKNLDNLSSNRSQKQITLTLDKKQSALTKTSIYTQKQKQIKPSIQSQKVFEQKPKIQKPIKRLVQKSIKKAIIVQKRSIIQQELSQSVYIQKPTSANIEKGIKRFSFPQKSIIGNNLSNKFSKKQVIASKIVSKNSQISQQNWKERTLTLRNKNIQVFKIPQQAEVEYLFAINCKIKQINLNECFSLISLTVNNNKIQSLQFLEQTEFGGYENLQQLYLDNNQINNLDQLPVYLRLKKISLAFNKLCGLESILKILIRIPSLEQLDFSFNPIRKQANYKQSIISVCKNLKKLDGIIVTRYDRQLANQYQKIYYQNNKVIPLNINNKAIPLHIINSPTRSNNESFKDNIRPNTAVSTNYIQSETNYSQINNISLKQLDNQIQILQKMIKNTKQQFQIIKQQNITLEQQIKQCQKHIIKKYNNDQIDNPKLYKKLCNQVEELQMLNFMQYASEKELQELLIKKIKQNGFGMQLLSAN